MSRRRAEQNAVPDVVAGAFSVAGPAHPTPSACARNSIFCALRTERGAGAIYRPARSPLALAVLPMPKPRVRAYTWNLRIRGIACACARAQTFFSANTAVLALPHSVQTKAVVTMSALYRNLYNLRRGRSRIWDSADSENRDRKEWRRRWEGVGGGGPGKGGVRASYVTIYPYYDFVIVPLRLYSQKRPPAFRFSGFCSSGGAAWRAQ